MCARELKFESTKISFSESLVTRFENTKIKVFKFKNFNGHKFLHALAFPQFSPVFKQRHIKVVNKIIILRALSFIIMLLSHYGHTEIRANNVGLGLEMWIYHPLLLPFGYK